MNLKKLVEIARKERPDRSLAKLSIQWAEQNKLGNPVRSAVSLWRWRWFMGINITLFLLWLTITIVWKPNMSTISNQSPSLWSFVALVLAVIFFSALACKWDDENSTFKSYRDAKCFLKAITVLESVLGKPLERWISGDDLQAQAEIHLKELALRVKTKEKVEKDEIERVPWVTPSAESSSSPSRCAFNSDFELLTSLLPLPKDKGFYYGNGTSTEVPATV